MCACQACVKVLSNEKAYFCIISWDTNLSPRSITLLPIAIYPPLFSPISSEPNHSIHSAPISLSLSSSFSSFLSPLPPFHHSTLHTAPPLFPPLCPPLSPSLPLPPSLHPSFHPLQRINSYSLPPFVPFLSLTSLLPLHPLRHIFSFSSSNISFSRASHPLYISSNPLILIPASPLSPYYLHSIEHHPLYQTKNSRRKLR